VNREHLWMRALESQIFLTAAAWRSK